MHRGHLHLYGHSRGALKATPDSLDVGVDCWNWSPAAFDQILARQSPTPAMA
ncbi:hypothetical protein G3T14_16765 [Methylobacterium sp. BTF04]|uniref:hypothetical protein n=1 Tax=Methylobacterium sp. BTF04 TaxID=2708300 RepID=UPI0013D152CA|nr:hypothetical protein [Methylobacterium sp. BTF04]NEU13771.1 hypothetical protein [Methylobacterium sp. BTF04]